jgi:hypothetical protein
MPLGSDSLSDARVREYIRQLDGIIIQIPAVPSTSAAGGVGGEETLGLGPYRGRCPYMSEGTALLL